MAIETEDKLEKKNKWIVEIDNNNRLLLTIGNQSFVIKTPRAKNYVKAYKKMLDIAMSGLSERENLVDIDELIRVGYRISSGRDGIKRKPYWVRPNDFVLEVCDSFNEAWIAASDHYNKNK